MFDKLSFEELATFYTALAELEKHYGKAAVQAAAADMANVLDTKSQMEFQFEESDIQKDDEKKPVKRIVTSRRSPGENEKQIREWCKEKFTALTPEEALLSMYYQDGLTQAAIGAKIGVKQRAVGYFINNIPEKKKRKILSSFAGAADE